MNTSAGSNCRKLLLARANGFTKVRSFFERRSVLEVDCPALSSYAPIDPHIDVMSVDTGLGKGYLHTSPEYGMKKLLSQGSGDIYQLSHVFRASEIGALHHPEFTMLEWYRIGFSFQKMVDETVACIHLFLPDLDVEEMSYKALFQKRLNIDPIKASCDELLKVAKEQGCHLSESALFWGKDTLLQFLLADLIEPTLGQDRLFVLTHFPESQAALAEIAFDQDQERVALRFEIYYQGIELANGYKELRDPFEQKKRLNESNRKRVEMGKESLPMDKEFIAALTRGLPDCSGVALGFDRLLQLSLKEKTVASVLPH